MSSIARIRADQRSEITKEVMGVLEEMFSDTGMETILYYLKVDYNTSCSDAWEDPSKFQDSLVEFLGDFGGKLLLRRMITRISSLGPAISPAKNQTLSLESAVGLLLPPDSAEVQVPRLSP